MPSGPGRSSAGLAGTGGRLFRRSAMPGGMSLVRSADSFGERVRFTRQYCQCVWAGSRMELSSLSRPQKLRAEAVVRMVGRPAWSFCIRRSASDDPHRSPIIPTRSGCSCSLRVPLRLAFYAELSSRTHRLAQEISPATDLDFLSSRAPHGFLASCVWRGPRHAIRRRLSSTCLVTTQALSRRSATGPFMGGHLGRSERWRESVRASFVEPRANRWHLHIVQHNDCGRQRYRKLAAIAICTTRSDGRHGTDGNFASARRFTPSFTSCRARANASSRGGSRRRAGRCGHRRRTRTDSRSSCT